MINKAECYYWIDGLIEVIVKHGTDLFHTYSKMIVIVWESEI